MGLRGLNPATLDAFRWPALARAAESAIDRPQVVQQLARDFVPEYGTLPPEAAARLVDACEQVLTDSWIVPVHDADPIHIPSMLDDGFAWPRWREADGFEPYEDKLREWSALGDGERSEDFLFTGIQFLDGSLPLEQAITAAADVRELWNGYGSTSLVFAPDTLIGASILPSVYTQAHHGSTAGTIEHLPEVIAERLAGGHGFLADNEVAFHRLLGDSEKMAMVREAAERQQPELLAILDQPRDQRVEEIRRLITSNGGNHAGDPVEAHLRPTADDVIHVDLARPYAYIGEMDLPPGTFRASRIDDAANVDLTRHAVVSASELIPRPDVDAIAHSAERRRIPISGYDEQLAFHELIDRSTARHGQDVVVRFDSVVESEPTAVGTSQLRRQVAAARAADAAVAPPLANA